MAGSGHGSPGETFSDWERWGLSALALIAFGCGSLGFRQYYACYGPDTPLLTAAYHAVQLFVLHSPHLEHPVPLTLHVGRWLAPAVFFWAVLKTANVVLQTNWQALARRWRRNHVVVCGLGTLGLPIALQARDRGWKPVAIEKDPGAEGVRVAIRRHIPVVIGDATDTKILTRARVHRARQIFALCAQDDVNVGIAALLGHPELHKGGTTGLECCLFVGDPRLRASLREQARLASQGERYTVRVHGVDLPTLRARRVLADNPLDHLLIPPGSKKRARLVIAGFGEMGEALALQGARIGHFASEEKLHVTIVDEQATRLMAAFAARYPMFGTICDVAVEDGPLDAPDIVVRLAAACRDAEAHDEPMTIAVCHDGNDALNLSLALGLVPALPGCRSQVLVYLSAASGFAHLMPRNETPQGKGHGAKTPVPPRRLVDERLRPFGMIEEVWTVETLLDEQQDALARAAHEQYCDSLRARREKGEQIPRRPAEAPWEELAETYRDSNRALADHYHIKLRAVGLREEELCVPWQPVPQFEPAAIELLARMEHARWCAERWLAGWTVGARDDARKKHPDLVPWGVLPDTESRIDRDMMAGICRALAAAREAQGRRHR